MTVDSARLRGARILIVEDDYYLAADLETALKGAGATIVGPFGDEEQATVAMAGARPDCAFVDVNLGAGPSFAVAHALTTLDVPFVFVTGYDAETIPSAFAAVACIQKPVAARRVVNAAVDLLQRS